MPRIYLVRSLSIVVMTLFLGACAKGSDWPSLSCWGDVAPASADHDGSRPPQTDRLTSPTPDVVKLDVTAWKTRWADQLQAYHKAVARIETASSKEAASQAWLGAQLELSGLAYLMSDLDKAAEGDLSSPTLALKQAWAAEFKKLGQQMRALKP